MKTNNTHPELERSPLIDALRAACADEAKAVEFMEARRWGDNCQNARCPHCESNEVYKMQNRNGTRNSRFLWRCRACGEQYTVRIGMVCEDSRLPMKHWCYAFHRACTSKKGVSAREIQRDCQISYKSALFLMHRIRFAMTPEAAPKLRGKVECDETYVGGKPRPGTGYHKRGRGTSKTPVFAMVQRNGQIRSRVMACVTAHNLRKALVEHITPGATILTDEYRPYRKATKGFEAHKTVNHSAGEYVRGDVHTNTAESSFAILKRGIMGIYHAVSKEHLHRYVSEFDFRWNTRKMNDGQRTALAIQGAEGKRLTYERVA